MTPHGVNIIDDMGNIVKSFPAEGTVARAVATDSPVGEVDGIELVRTKFGKPTDLPEPESGTYYIVSLATAQAAMEDGRITTDLLLTSGPVRDGEGRIIGCRRFALL